MKKCVLALSLVAFIVSSGTASANRAGPNTKYCTNYLLLGPDFGMDLTGCVFDTRDEP